MMEKEDIIKLFDEYIGRDLSRTEISFLRSLSFGYSGYIMTVDFHRNKLGRIYTYESDSVFDLYI